jgi:DNA invertase Pin-like site-specific DNA recombinase
MARKGKQLIEAVGYMRTSSATNVGADKDSEKRQRAAIESYAKAAGYHIVDWFYDAAVRGSDAVTERPGFSAMLDRIAGNGVRTVLVESPDRFARDLAVQLAGHDYLKRLGVELIPTSAPDFFTEDTPSAVLIGQVLGAVAEFQKTDLVVKLRAARERIRKATGKCGGRKTYAERDSDRDRAMLVMAKQLSEQRPVSRCARSARRHRRPATSHRRAIHKRLRPLHRCWPALSRSPPEAQGLTGLQGSPSAVDISMIGPLRAANRSPWRRTPMASYVGWAPLPRMGHVPTTKPRSFQAGFFFGRSPARRILTRMKWAFLEAVSVRHEDSRQYEAGDRWPPKEARPAGGLFGGEPEHLFGEGRDRQHDAGQRVRHH